jgi:hypothetical protein
MENTATINNEQYQIKSVKEVGPATGRLMIINGFCPARYQAESKDGTRKTLAKKTDGTGFVSLFSGWMA